MFLSLRITAASLLYILQILLEEKPSQKKLKAFRLTLIGARNVRQFTEDETKIRRDVGQSENVVTLSLYECVRGKRFRNVSCSTFSLASGSVALMTFLSLLSDVSL